jgi:hypothetical protein
MKIYRNAWEGIKEMEKVDTRRQRWKWNKKKESENAEER